jgi:hypothetical protein
MNKGYAFGFLIVLLVVALGFYVAITGFMSSREALRAQATQPSSTKASQVTRLPTEPLPTATATETAATETYPPTDEPPPADTAAPAPTEPPALQPSDTPTAVAQPPTPAPEPAYQFRLGGPPSADPNYPNCCYIFGTVRDAAGNPLEGVPVKAFNEWNDLPPAITKGGGEAGQYNIPIGHDAVSWYVVVVDAAGNHISTQAPVPFDPNAANGYRVDWQRSY